MSYTTTNLPFIQTSITSYAEYVLDSNNNYQVALTYPSQFEPDSIMTAIIEIDSPVDIGINTLKVVLPPTANASRGYNARIINIGNHPVSIYKNVDNLLVTVSAGQYVDVYLAKEIWKYTSSSGYVPSDVTASDLVGPGLSLYPYLIGSNIRLATNAPVLEINESIYYLKQQNRAFTLINKLPESTFYVDINFDIGYYFSIYNESDSNCYVQDPNSGQAPFVITPKQCVTFKKIRDDEQEPILEKRWLLEYGNGQVAPPKFLLIDVKNQFNQVILPDSIFTANILDIVNNQSNNLKLLIPDPFIGGWVVINNASDRFQLSIALQNNPNATILLPYGVPTEIISDGQKLYSTDSGTINLSKGALFVGNDNNVPSELHSPNKFGFLISDDSSNTRFSSSPQSVQPLIKHHEPFSDISSFVKDVELAAQPSQHDLWIYFDMTNLNVMDQIIMEDVKEAGYTGCIWGWGTMTATVSYDSVSSTYITTTDVGFISLDPLNPTAEYDLCMSLMQEAKDAGIEKHVLSFGGPYDTWKFVVPTGYPFVYEDLDDEKLRNYVINNGFTGFNIDYQMNPTNPPATKLGQYLTGTHWFMNYSAGDGLTANVSMHLSNSGTTETPTPLGFEYNSQVFNKKFNRSLISGGFYNLNTAHVMLFNTLGQQNSNYINQTYYGNSKYTNWTILTDVEFRYSDEQRISLMLPVGAAGSYYGKSPDLNSESAAFSPYYPHYNGNGSPTNAPDSCGTVLTIEQMLRTGLVDSYGTAVPMFDVLKEIKHDKKFSGITAYLGNIDFKPSAYTSKPSWSGNYPAAAIAEFGMACKAFLHTNVNEAKFATPVIKQDLFYYKNDVLESINFSLRIILPALPERYPEYSDCNLYLGVSYLKEFDEDAMIFSALLQQDFISHLIHDGTKYKLDLINQNIIFNTPDPIIEPCTIWVYFAYDPNQSSITNGEIDFYWNNYTDVQLYNVTITSYLEPHILEENAIFKGGTGQTIDLVQPPKQLAIFCADQLGNVGWTKVSDIKYNIDHQKNVGTYINEGESYVSTTTKFYSPYAYFVVDAFPNNYLSEILFDLYIKIISTTTDANKNCNLYIGLEPKTNSPIKFDYAKLVYNEMLLGNIVGTSPVTIQEKFTILNAVSALKEPAIIWIYFGIDEIQRQQQPPYALSIQCDISKSPFVDLIIYSTPLYLPNIHLLRGSIFYVDGKRKIKQAQIGMNELVAGVGTDEIGAIASNKSPLGLLLTENYKPTWQSKGISDPYINHANIIDILEVNGFTEDNSYLLPFSRNKLVPRLWQGRRKTSIFFPLYNSYEPFLLNVSSSANRNNFITVKGMVPKHKWQVPVFKSGSDNSMEFQFGIGMCNASTFHVDINTGWNKEYTEALGRIDDPSDVSSFYFVPCSDNLVLDGTYDDRGNEPQEDMYFEVSFRATPDFHIPWEEERALFFCFYPIKEGSSWNDNTIWTCSKGNIAIIQSMKYYPYTDATEVDLFTTGALWAIDEEKKLYPILGGVDGDVIIKEQGFPVWTSFELLKGKIKNDIMQEIMQILDSQSNKMIEVDSQKVEK